MYGLDHQAVRTLADERMARLQDEMARVQRHPRGRERLGLWLVGFGFRVAGQVAPPPQRVPTA